MKVKVTGDRELKAAAGKLRSAVGAAAFGRRARVATAERVADAARVEAPRRTGQLARSTVAVAQGDTVEVVVQAAHGGPVHAGRRKGRRGGRMAPDPFVDRAIAREGGRLEAELEQDLGRAFDAAGW